MDPRAIHDYYRFYIKKYVGPRYYAYPDGEDLPGKMSFCGQLATLISAPIGIVNAYIRYPYPTTQKGRWLRVARAMGPGIGMGLAFAITTYYATRYRQKDDIFNHALGGIAAGTVFGAVNGFSSGCVMSLILAGVAIGFKADHEYLKPKTQAHRTFSPYFQRNMDFSGIPEIKGNWAKSP